MRSQAKSAGQYATTLFRRAGGILPSAALVLLATVRAVAAPVHDYQALVSEWVDLRLELAAEQREWETTKSRWQDEIELLAKEKAALQAELKQYGELRSSAEDERSRLLEEKRQLEQTVRKLEPVLDRLEADIRSWKRRLPASLKSGPHDVLRDIPATHTETQHRPVTRRLQLVAAFYTQLETLQHRVHVTREMLHGADGRRREVDVIYLGLAQAFAVSPDNRWAAVGRPSGEGWTWTDKPDLSADVRKAVDVFTRREPAALVTLPVQVRDIETKTATPATQEEKP